MKTLCYVFIFLFEQIVSYLFFNNKFYLKKPKFYLFTSYFLSFIIQFLGNILGNRISMPELNLFTFFVCNIIIVILMFETSIKQAFFNTLLLEGLMITSELGVMHLTSLLLHVDLQEYLKDNTIIVLETVGTKTLYFTLAYFISKISTKEKRNSVKDISYFLFVLPLLSVGIIISFTYLSINYSIEQLTKVVFTIISIFLLFANIIIFIVHETMIKTLSLNTELQLENQKNKINKEYYNELQNQYESSNILIHDIKKCLLNIKNFASKNDSKSIISYIDSIYQGYEINKLKRFTNHKLTNIIISRYNELCINSSIDFCVDIRDVDFSFISDGELTALLDNLLENAYNAALISYEKTISLVVDKFNENYIILVIENSTDKAPKIDRHKKRLKNNTNGFHGIGLKSVSKVVSRYSGNIEYQYNEQSKHFIVTVVLKTTKNESLY